MQIYAEDDSFVGWAGLRHISKAFTALDSWLLQKFGNLDSIYEQYFFIFSYFYDMSTKYRFSSDAFGIHLERMHPYMVNMYLSYLHTGAWRGNYCYYFNIRIEAGDLIANDPIFVMTVDDNTTLEQVAICLNKAYVNLFAIYNYDKERQSQHISISVDREYTWDKYNKTYLPTIRIHDAYFFTLYYKDAVKFWLGK